MGQLYLTNIDFLKNGVPASIIAMLVSLCWVFYQTVGRSCHQTGCLHSWISAYDGYVSVFDRYFGPLGKLTTP
jgi:hypothetical protein